MIVVTIMLAHIINVGVLVLVNSVKVPSERRKMFTERMPNGNLLLLKGFLARFKSIITEIHSSIYENMYINVKDMFNITIKINYKYSIYRIFVSVLTIILKLFLKINY